MTKDAIRLCVLKFCVAEDLTNLPYSYYIHTVRDL